MSKCSHPGHFAQSVTGLSAHACEQTAPFFWAEARGIAFLLLAAFLIVQAIRTVVGFHALNDRLKSIEKKLDEGRR